MKECITHHHACDCREAEFESVRAENPLLKKRVVELEAALNWMRDNRALTVFIEEPEHVADFFAKADAVFAEPPPQKPALIIPVIQMAPRRRSNP